MRRGWRTAAAAALAVLALGGGWLTWSLHRKTTADYVTQKPETGSVARTITASGIVGPAATAPVIARLSGVIQALACDAKMKVKAGQVCAKIDPRPYQIIVDPNKSDLAAAEARFEKDKADLAHAKAAFEHHEALAKRRAISQKAIEKARKAYEQAQAQTKLEEVTVGGDSPLFLIVANLTLIQVGLRPGKGQYISAGLDFKNAGDQEFFGKLRWGDVRRVPGVADR